MVTNTAIQKGLGLAIIEEDLFVCAILGYLFTECSWKNNLAFKGGTSLSKAFNLIERFSEDIDLILNWRVIGYGAKEPLEDHSNTKQDALNKEFDAKTEEFLRSTFIPTPTKVSTIRPYIAEVYPVQFSDASVSIRTTTPERTFWEKATILHHEANRPDFYLRCARERCYF